MGLNKPSSATTTDMKNQVANFEGTPQDTSINEYIPQWSKWYGYYAGPGKVSAYSSLVDKKALWTVGKGFTANPATTKILGNIRGFGKDTFNTIMSNAVRVYTLGGDFLAEQIRNSRNKLVNLKPLNPGQWKFKANSKGIIKEYEQISQEITGENAGKANTKLLTLPADKIFHLPWNRTADDIHGVGTTEKLQDDLDAYKETLADQRIVFHRYVKPLLVFGVSTDDPKEIADFRAKVDSCVKNGENLIVPQDVLDKIQNISVPQFGTLDPLPWAKYLESNFFKAEGVPAVVNASASGSTEAEAKIMYLAWQQVVEWNQLFLEEQIKAQLGLEVEFNFPASIAPDLVSDTKTDETKKGTKDNKAGMNPAGGQD